MFESSDSVGKLSGRIVVQLSIGTPKEARESEAWFVAHSANVAEARA